MIKFWSLGFGVWSLGLWLRLKVQVWRWRLELDVGMSSGTFLNESHHVFVNITRHSKNTIPTVLITHSHLKKTLHIAQKSFLLCIGIVSLKLLVVTVQSIISSHLKIIRQVNDLHRGSKKLWRFYFYDNLIKCRAEVAWHSAVYCGWCSWTLDFRKVVQKQILERWWFNLSFCTFHFWIQQRWSY